jgi:simple sugar transport system permease protein
VLLQKRTAISSAGRITNPLLSIAIGLVVGGVVIAFAGIDPITAYAALAVGAFGSVYNITETIVAATPLILISVGLLLVFKMKFWNIGAYGQYIMGAIFSSYVALNVPSSTSPFIVLSLMCLLGILGGALWAIIPAVLRVVWEVNEVIATLMMNYIGLYVLYYLVNGPWRDPTSHGFPLSKTFPLNAQLPILLSHSRVHLGILFGIAAVVVIYFINNRTKFGYENRVIGGNSEAARYAGINIFRNTIIAMVLSGGLAGLAGMAQVAGVIHLLQIQINPGYGYTAIIVTWLSGLNPFLAILASILIGGIEAGGYQIQMLMHVPFGIVGVVESSILFALLGGEIFRTNKLVVRRKGLRSRIRS